MLDTEAIAPISRTITLLDGRLLTLVLGECGIDVWLSLDGWPNAFPLPAMQPDDWQAFVSAVFSIKGEARQRAKIHNTVERLLDPEGEP